MLRQLRWLKLAEIAQMSKILLLNKIIVTQAAPYCFALVKVGMETHQTKYSVRERELRIAWKPRLVKKGCSSFLFTATRLYNQVKLMGKVLTTGETKSFIKKQIVDWR